ncbi:MAG: substrate-binding domain-containing protein [Marinilabiliales bacterium]|nr:substrate-binding domain-containing protein [Marinilabiliales bacterium]
MKYLLLPLIFFLLSGCRFFQGKPGKEGPVAGKVSIVVDESLLPVIANEWQVFLALYGDAEIRIQALPERECIRKLLTDSTTLAVVTRKLEPDEVALLKERQLFPRQDLMGQDAIALIVHPSVQDSVISIDQLRNLLMGNGMNEKSAPLLPSKVVFDNRNSGMLRFLTDSLCGGKMTTSAITALDKTEEVIAYTASHADVIGVVGNSWLVDRNDPQHNTFRQQVKMLAVSRKAMQEGNHFLPVQEHLNGHRYPLLRNIYLINTEPRSGLSSGFVSFLNSDKGQRILLKSGILPAKNPEREVNVRPSL